RRDVERAVDDQRHLGVAAVGIGDRALEYAGKVSLQPVTKEPARGLDGELRIFPLGRPQGPDPGFEILLRQRAAKPALRLEPDGVEHPTTPLRPDPCRAPEDPTTRDDPHLGTTPLSSPPSCPS